MARAAIFWLVLWGLTTMTAPLAAQRAPLPTYYGTAPYAGPPQATPPTVWPNPAAPGVPFPNAGIPSAIPPVGTGLPMQPFDPYANTGLPTAPGIPAPYSQAPFAPPVLPASPLPTATPGVWPGTSPTPWLPGTSPASPTITAPGLGDPAPLTPPAYPGAPGNPAGPWGTGGSSWGNSGANGLESRPFFQTDPFASGNGQTLQRLFQDTGFRYTYLWGDEGNQLTMHEVDVSTTAVFPNFLGSKNGLRLSPGFTFDFLDGPSGPITADMPPQLYAAYLDTWWNPQITPQISAELNFRTGVYSDFETFTTDSLRFIGTAVGVVRITPSTSFKLGATYLDRNHIKLLPAAGILWEPNPQTRWDIFFPAPKLASYFRTIRNTEVWWYVGGEYGGGSWTMQREEDPAGGASERVDINDIRVFLGLEGWSTNRLYSFLEVGYVFERELYYVLVPEDRTTLDDTFMIRAGISF